MLTIEGKEYEIYGDPLYYCLNFSINLKLFKNLQYLLLFLKADNTDSRLCTQWDVHLSMVFVARRKTCLDMLCPLSSVLATEFNIICGRTGNYVQGFKGYWKYHFTASSLFFLLLFLCSAITRIQTWFWICSVLEIMWNGGFVLW